MKMKKFKYVKPKTIEEALGYLDDNVNEKKVIAGGTDLMVKLKNNKIAPDLIIDISEIETLKGIYRKDGFIVIGAATTLTEIAESALLKKYCPILPQAAASIGAAQIRNRGTIGYHIVRPVHHWSLHKLHGMGTNFKFIPCFNQDILPVLLKVHLQALFTVRCGDNLRIRSNFHNLGDTPGMIQFHMVDHQVIDLLRVHNSSNPAQHLIG
jgi:hypothetical protein